MAQNMKTSTGVKNAVKVSPVDMEARKNLDLRPGDTVRVWQKIEKKGKTPPPPIL